MLFLAGCLGSIDWAEELCPNATVQPPVQPPIEPPAGFHLTNIRVQRDAYMAFYCARKDLFDRAVRYNPPGWTLVNETDLPADEFLGARVLKDRLMTYRRQNQTLSIEVVLIQTNDKNITLYDLIVGDTNESAYHRQWNGET